MLDSFRSIGLAALSFIILSLSAVACGGSNAAGPENVFIADEGDSGQSITMGVGDVLQITLDENQSTGYLWNIVTNDEGVLRLSDTPAYEVESDADGAGGRKTFMFEAVAPGTSVLRMIYAMEQETAVEPDRTFELTVEVVN